MVDLEKPKQEPRQEILKAQLLAGRMAPNTFIDELWALDQATPTRDAAEQNALILADRQVQEVLLRSEFRTSYFNLLSLSHFHVGQRKVVEGDEALSHFEHALTAANEAGTEGEEWKLYVEGTVAYLKKDIQSLQASAAKLSEGRNKYILESFHQGLQERGSIDYLADMQRKI